MARPASSTVDTATVVRSADAAIPCRFWSPCCCCCRPELEQPASERCSEPRPSSSAARACMAPLALRGRHRAASAWLNAGRETLQSRRGRPIGAAVGCCAAHRQRCCAARPMGCNRPAQGALVGCIGKRPALAPCTGARCCAAAPKKRRAHTQTVTPLPPSCDAHNQQSRAAK